MKKPLLIDLDGVLRLGNTPAPGLASFFEYLRSGERKAVIISNTTQYSATSIYQFFEKYSLPVPCEMMTAADATALYIKTRYNRAALFCKERIKPLFGDIENYENPEVVVMGDMGKEWNFENLNSIFKYVKNGADLVAMQKNKFWSTPEDGLLLDLGAFVASIEYATGVKAKLIGKPSEIYFNTGLEKIDESGNSFYMLGDDLENDIAGAKNTGGKGILILTGKTTAPLSKEYENTPDYIVENLQEAVQLLEKLD